MGTVIICVVLLVILLFLLYKCVRGLIDTVRGSFTVGKALVKNNCASDAVRIMKNAEVDGVIPGSAVAEAVELMIRNGVSDSDMYAILVGNKIEVDAMAFAQLIAAKHDELGM